MPHHPLARGLAVSAVSALVLTGLAVAPAQAVGPDVSFISIFNAAHRASTRLDSDQNRSITLTGAVDDTDSPTVTFEYNANPSAGPATGGWTPTTGMSAPVAQGIATEYWSPTTLDGTTIAVRMVATTEDGTSYAIRNNVSVTGAASPVDSVKAFSNGGYFVQPYAGSSRTRTLKPVSGTTSATNGSVQLSWWRASDKTFQGQVDAAVAPGQLKATGFPSTPTYVNGGTFNGVLDITAYGADPDDVLVLAAERDTDDVVPVTLYSQVPTSASIAQRAPKSTGTPVDVTVRDQLGSPVAGAEVRRVSDGGLVGYTDGAGTATANQPGDTSESYYVNTTDSDALDGGDPTTAEIAVDPYVPVVTSTVAKVADGAVFDDDEYAAGDIALQVVDQEGTPFGSGAELQYRLYRTGTTPPAFTTATADGAGRVVVPFDAAGPDGSYTLDYTTPTSAPVVEEFSTTFVAGDSTLSLSPGLGSAASGGQITYTGSLIVGGKPLPGRKVDLSYTRGAELAPGLVADAGMVGVGGALAGTVATAADGSFTVVVKDPAKSGNPAETGGRLSAATATNVPSGSSTLAGNAQESAASAADFTAGPGVVPGVPLVKTVKIVLKGKSKRGAADKLTVVTPASVKGEMVTISRKVGKGKWKKVVTRTLGASGLKLRLKDPNGAKPVLYRATVIASTRVKTSTSKILKLK